MARGSETQGGLPRLGVRLALMHLLRKRGRGVLRGQLLQQVCKTVKANTMADLPLCRPLGALPAHGLLADGPPRLVDELFGRGDAHAGVAEQLATALDLDTAH